LRTIFFFDNRFCFRPDASLTEEMSIEKLHRERNRIIAAESTFNTNRYIREIFSGINVVIQISRIMEGRDNAGGKLTR
jgi:hypothetical protein